jgi:hypothetical protein
VNSNVVFLYVKIFVCYEDFGSLVGLVLREFEKKLGTLVEFREFTL